VGGEEVVEAEPSKPTTAHPMRNFLIIAIALLAVKLLLISRREIVPEPYDAEEYVALSLENLRAIFAGGADHAPGASLIMALARLLGIPYRIFTELILAAAAFLFFRPLVVWTRIGVGAVAFCYALLLFHPALILWLDRSMSDPVNFICWLAGAGGVLGVVAAPRDRFPRFSLGLAIVSFAFAGITRSADQAIVFVEMITLAMLSILLFRGLEAWRRRRALIACLCAVGANFTATQALSAVHSVTSGYWGVTAVESSDWRRLYGTLLSLPVQRNDPHLLVNKATMEMAASFSSDLRSMSGCIQRVQVGRPTEELPNDGAAWVIINCLPDENSLKNFARLRTISQDIILGSREHDLALSAPILGVVPRPATQWLPYLSSSVAKVALDTVRIPESTRITQNSYNEELFNRALLRRAALAAAADNPEVIGYQSFLRPLYRVAAALFWPSVPLAFVVVAAIVIRSPGNAAKSSLPAFFLSIVTIDVLCRISFYSMVQWILWDIPARYVLGASALSIVVVATLLTVWLAPAAGSALKPVLLRLPRRSRRAQKGDYPDPSSLTVKRPH
jgi:hypothetical protein